MIPSKYTQFLFILGMAIYIIGQALLAQGTEFVQAQKPIDYAHWCLWIGIVLSIPQSLSFHKGIHSYVGIPFTLIGIANILGMCVIDFILWSFDTIQARNEFIAYLSKVDVIWIPFIKIGTGFFNIGLAILSLNYLRSHTLGCLAVILGTITIFGVFPLNNSIIYGYILITLGFTYLFYTKASTEGSMVHLKN